MFFFVFHSSHTVWFCSISFQNFQVAFVWQNHVNGVQILKQLGCINAKEMKMEKKLVAKDCFLSIVKERSIRKSEWLTKQKLGLSISLYSCNLYVLGSQRYVRVPPKTRHYVKENKSSKNQPLKKSGNWSLVWEDWWNSKNPPATETERIK